MGRTGDRGVQLSPWRAAIQTPITSGRQAIAPIEPPRATILAAGLTDAVGAIRPVTGGHNRPAARPRSTGPDHPAMGSQGGLVALATGHHLQSRCSPGRQGRITPNGITAAARVALATGQPFQNRLRRADRLTLTPRCQAGRDARRTAAPDRRVIWHRSVSRGPSRRPRRSPAPGQPSIPSDMTVAKPSSPNPLNRVLVALE